MKLIRVIYRGSMMVIFMTTHISLVVIKSFFRGPNLQHALAARQIWVSRMLRVLGVKVEKHGAPPPGNHLYVGNHRSYIDPLVALMDVRALPVAKAEVADWPIIGYGAKATGVMYVKRDSKSSRAATLEAIRQTLQLGFSVLVYPEGTTHIQPISIDFRTGAFNMAAKEGFSVVPMAIDYADMGDAWIGDDGFLPHFFRCFGKKRTLVKIKYGQPLRSDDVNFLVTESKRWIDENLLDIRQAFESEKISVSVSALA